MMRISLLLLLLPFLGIAQPKNQRPNIIIFLVDDMGWQDTSVPFWKEKTPFNQRFRTPNMELLAAGGMLFTNAYATPVCTPTRVSMITGMNAAHHGVTNWTTPTGVSSDADDKEFIHAPWNHKGLSPVAGVPHTVHATPLPQILKDNGYYTVHVGKAHWASNGTPGSSPLHLGFMVNIAGHAAGHPQSYYGKDNFGNIPGKASIQAVPDLWPYHGTGTFLTEALTLEAIKAIETPIARKQPFFLHLSHYAIHVPLHADLRFYSRYLAAGLDSNEARYAALVEGMDKSLGDVMDFLRSKNAEKNTVIIFMSDNGALSVSPPRSRPSFTHNLPLRSGKGSVYEGGVRIPMIVSWPGRIQPGSVSRQYTMPEDIFPTVLALARIPNASILQKVDGRPMTPFFSNPSRVDSSRVLIWHYPNKWINEDGPGINYCSAVRQGSWKLVHYLRSGRLELYNLSTDIGEQQDLSRDYPQIVNRLYDALNAHLKKWNSPTVKKKDPEQ